MNGQSLWRSFDYFHIFTCEKRTIRREWTRMYARSIHPNTSIDHVRLQTQSEEALNYGDHVAFISKPFLTLLLFFPCRVLNVQQ